MLRHQRVARVEAVSTSGLKGQGEQCDGDLGRTRSLDDGPGGCRDCQPHTQICLLPPLISCWASPWLNPSRNQRTKEPGEDAVLEASLFRGGAGGDQPPQKPKVGW